MTAAGALDVWEAGLMLNPAARAILLLEAAGHRDPAGWPVGTRNQILLRSLSGAGGAVAAVADCPECGMALDLVFDPAQLGSSTAAQNIGAGAGNPQDTLTVDHQDYRVRCRLPTAGDLDHLDPRTSLEDQRDQLLSACLLHAARAGAALGLPTPRRARRSIRRAG